MIDVKKTHLVSLKTPIVRCTKITFGYGLWIENVTFERERAWPLSLMETSGEA